MEEREAQFEPAVRPVTSQFPAALSLNCRASQTTAVAPHVTCAILFLFFDSAQIGHLSVKYEQWADVSYEMLFSDIITVKINLKGKQLSGFITCTTAKKKPQKISEVKALHTESLHQ